MTKKTIIICVISFLTLLSITLGLILIVNYICTGWGEPVTQTIKLEIVEGTQKEVLYIKFRAWGLIAGNHEEIVISPYRDSLANPETDYIINGETELFLDYSQKKIVLIIPTMQQQITAPKTKYTNFVIKQDDFWDLRRRYKNNQLIRIDLFEKQNSILIIKNE
ncbi:MAG: hypothetical protein J5604_03120 [Bacteroidales bacterium]|nr:hypothetical protein [Bacteroidales bacterium]